MKSPPPENRTMKKAIFFSTMITTTLFMLCGCMIYVAFGENTNGNLLLRWEFYKPYWLVDFVNACIVAHLLGEYQVIFFSKCDKIEPMPRCNSIEKKSFSKTWDFGWHCICISISSTCAWIPSIVETLTFFFLYIWILWKIGKVALTHSNE